MANVKPSLNKIVAFDATKGATFSFLWSGAQSQKNRIIIKTYDSPQKVVYDCTVTTMMLEHTLYKSKDGSDTVSVNVPYALENNTKYTAIVYTYDIKGELSIASDEVMFYCYQTPVFEFTNFDVFQGDVAKTAYNSIYLTVHYSQENGETLNDYEFILYDSAGSVLLKSNTFYGSNSDDVLRYTLKGVTDTEKKDGVVDVNRYYRIVCRGNTIHGMMVTAEQKFVVQKDEGGVGALVRISKTFDNIVTISSNFKIVNAQLDGDEIYLKDSNDNPYAISLIDGQNLKYFDSFVMNKPWSITAIVGGCNANTVLINAKDSANNEFSISYKIKKYNKSEKAFFLFEDKVGLTRTVIKSDYLPIIDKWYIVYLKYENGYYDFQIHDPEALGYTTLTSIDKMKELYPNSYLQKFIVKSSDVGVGASSKSFSITLDLIDKYSFEVGRKYKVSFTALNVVQNIYKYLTLTKADNLSISSNIPNATINALGDFYAKFVFTEDITSLNIQFDWTNLSNCTLDKEYIESWIYLILDDFEVAEYNSTYGDLENYTHKELSNYTYGELQYSGVS